MIRRVLVVVLRNRLRSTLIIMSAALGVACVIVLTGYAGAGSRALLDQIRRMGVNVLIVTPQRSRVVAGRARTSGTVTTLVEHDDVMIRRRVKGITHASPLVTGTFFLQAGDLSKTAPVVGCERDYFDIKDWPLTAGRRFDANDARRGERVVLLGHTIARSLFGTASPLGARIRMNRIPFTVIGVLSERGQGLDAGNEDEQVYVPLTTAMRRLLNVDHYSAIVIETNGEDLSKAIGDVLRAQHHAVDFVVQNQMSLVDTQRAAAARLRRLGASIATGALAISSAGIIGVSLISVKQRTRELGICRALGASARDVFMQILAETAVLAIAGAALGLALALLAQRSELSIALLAVASSIALNLVFALMPARRASRVDPIEALRYE